MYSMVEYFVGCALQNPNVNKCSPADLVAHAIECERLIKEHHAVIEKKKAQEYEQERKEREKKWEEEKKEKARYSLLYESINVYAGRSLKRISEMPKRSKYQKLLVREEANSVMSMYNHFYSKLPSTFISCGGGAPYGAGSYRIKFIEKLQKIISANLIQLV